MHPTLKNIQCTYTYIRTHTHIQIHILTRTFIVCGYHGPLAAAFGLHHYLFLYEWKASGKRPPSDEVLSQLAGEAKRFTLVNVNVNGKGNG